VSNVQRADGDDGKTERHVMRSPVRLVLSKALNQASIDGIQLCLLISGDERRPGSWAQCWLPFLAFVSSNLSTTPIVTEILYLETLMPTEHTGLPVSGYQPQSTEKVDLVNANKAAEERVLLLLDHLATLPDTDKRWLAIGRTAIENGFMAVNRAVLKPSRVKLAG
jgi:hypothetical protein